MTAKATRRVRRGVAVVASEVLEARCLPTVTALVIGTELEITLEGDDDVAVSADGSGLLLVTTGSVPLATFSPTLASSLTQVTITGGPEGNLIDLRGVNSPFSASLVISVDAQNGNDTILGSDFGESIFGGDGADVITGAAGNDSLDGGDGADTVSGGVGDDSLTGDDGADSVTGDDGNDRLRAGNGEDTVSGGNGNDLIFAGQGTDTAAGDAGDDTINGEAGNDLITGGTGNDSILGGGENDTLSGGDGNDTVTGQSGNDVLTGDLGDDSIVGSDGADSLLGGDGNDTLNAGADNDTVLGQDGNDSILGGNGLDLLFGDGNDPTSFGSGSDTILGQGGADTLNGGGGTDSINGGAGNDLVQSGDFDSTAGIILTIANAANVTEGAAGTTANAVFTVSLSRAAALTVTVQFTTADGSATLAGNDFTLTAGNLQFTPGQTTQTITVPIIGDGLSEADENFFVRISNSTNAVIGDTEGEVFIVNDDGWIAQGPGPATGGQSENVVPNDEVVGAVHVVLPHPTDPNILFVGGVNGGVWRTNNAQATAPNWTPLTDFQAAMSIGSMAFDPSNPNRLVAGIGRHSSFGFDGGALPGMLLSNDLGNTWTLISPPVLQGKNNSSIAVRGNTLLFGADFNFGSGVGMFRSTDGGTTWTTVSGTNGLAAGGIADIVRDPTTPTRLYATVLGQGVFRTDNEGASWVNVSVNDNSSGGLNATMTNGGNNNAEMGIASNGRVFVTAMINGQAAYIGFTDNQGATWTAMDLPRTLESNGETEGLQPRVQPGGQGIIHFSITVDPTNPNIVYVGGDRQDTPFPNFLGANNFSGRLFRGDTSIAPNGAVPSPQWAHLTHRNDIASIPTGGTASNSSPHADSRDMAFDAAGNLIEGDDGGLYRRTNPRSNTGDWFSISNNLQITEPHDLAHDPVSNIVITGNQDTGTTEQTASGSILWRSASTADGGDVAIDALAIPGQSIRYSSFQNLGAFRGRIVNAANAVQSTFFPALTVTGNGAAITVRFVTPTVTNDVAGDRLLIGGGNSLYESTNRGTTIAEVGVGIVANNGNTIVYGGRQGGNANPELIYVAEGNQIFRRTAAGNTFTTLAFPGQGIVGLVTDPNNFDNVFAADQANDVYRSTDGGTTWANISGLLNDPDLRDIEYVSLAGQPDSLVVGGRLGIYRMSFTAVGTWTELGASSLPNTSVMEMQYSSSNDTLYAGLLGRGAWAFPNASLGEQVSNPVAGSGGMVNFSSAGDTLIGGDGNDIILGADGDDVLNGMAGNDSLVGGLGDDSLLGGSDIDTLEGGLGDDTLEGQGGSDVVRGADGADIYVWNGASDGSDTLSSLSGYDTVRVNGSAAIDSYSVTQLNGELRVSDGAATIQISSVIQNVEINLGNGNDSLTIASLSQVLTPTLLTVNGELGNDTLTAVGVGLGFVRMQMFGGDGNDSLTGSNDGDSLDGGEGDDRIDGGAGDDLLFGQAGVDSILGGAGNDRAFGGEGTDSISGQSGNDSLNGDDGDDTIDGGLGNDSLDGGDLADSLLGGDGNDVVLGGADTDSLDGGAGNDTLQGGVGADTLSGSTGADSLLGNDGNDSLAGGDGADTLNGGDGNDTIAGELGNDLIGGAHGNDYINAGAGNDTISGGDGRDTLLGGGGADVLFGNDGNDSMNGQSGTDTIVTGEGTDFVTPDVADILDEAFVLSAALLAVLG